MLPEQQSRLVVVLVRARNPSNIGAVARAMHDFGFAHLRIVNDFAAPFAAAVLAGQADAQAAAKAAVDASSVLASATEHPTLAGAVADCTLVLGTTAVGSRRLDHPLYTLAGAAPLVQTALQPASAKVALLFGSEKTGLSNDELSLCHALVTIPMHTPAVGRHLSMNLGQAAAVCLYALSIAPDPARDPRLPGAPSFPPLRHAKGGVSPPATALFEFSPPPPTSADLDRLTTLLQEVLDQSGYTRRYPANSRPNTLRRLVRRMSHSAADTPVWSGILRQLLHALKQPPPQ